MTHERIRAGLAGALLGLAGWSAQAGAAPFDFTLPALDGRRFMTLSDAPRPALVNFWGVECPPCVAELPLLEAFARRHPAWTVWLVGTDGAETMQDFLARHPVALPVLRPGLDVARLMRRAGNRWGGLPYTIVLGLDGQVCARRAGALRETDLDAFAAACGPAGAPPQVR